MDEIRYEYIQRRSKRLDIYIKNNNFEPHNFLDYSALAA